jgi:hypothetical protein
MAICRALDMAAGGMRSASSVLVCRRAALSVHSEWQGEEDIQAR